MILPLVLGLLGIIALASSSKKAPNAATTAASIETLPLPLAGMAKQALATNDPTVLRTAADALEQQGFPEQAKLLRQTADAIKVTSSTKPVPEALQTLMAQSLAALTVDGSGRVTGPVTASGIQTASAAAAQIEAAGFPEAAAELRKFIEKAKLALPAPTPDQQLPLPGLPVEIAAQVNRAIQTNRDPKALRALAALLQSLPTSPEGTQAIQTLQALADQIDAAITTSNTLNQIQNTLPTVLPGASAPTVPSAPVTSSPGIVPPNPSTQTPVTVLPGITITAPGPLPPLPSGNTGVVGPGVPPLPTTKSKEAILAETVASGLVRIQAPVAATGSIKTVQGKENKTDVMRFQKQEALTQDGKFGPGTAQKMAKYTGNLPLVMYWPQGTNAAKVLAYRSAILDIADQAEGSGDLARASALRTAAGRERGQGGIVGTMPPAAA